MNKRKYIAFPILLSLLCINNVYAEDCYMEIIQDFYEIENIYKIDYKYDIEKKTYTLILKYSTNPIYEYKIYNIENIECKKINNTTKECYNFNPGKYSYEIYGKNNNCKQSVKVGDFEIKELKNYSTDPLCEGIEEFALCQEDYYKDMSYETFVSRVKTYKRTKQEKIEKENLQKQEEEKNKTQKQIKTYIEENLLQIIIVIIFIILVTITSIVGYKTMRKSRRLE